MRRIGSYIHQLPDWPQFTWQATALESLLGTVRHQQDRLLGRLDGLGLDLRNEATLQTLTLDVLKSSEIEGELLPPASVRSSLAYRLGLRPKCNVQQRRKAGLSDHASICALLVR